MIYKFDNVGSTMEVQSLYNEVVAITLYEYEDDAVNYRSIELDVDELHSLIGSLHVLKAKLEKEASNGK